MQQKRFGIKPKLPRKKCLQFYKFLVNYVKFVKQTQWEVLKRNRMTLKFVDFENKGSIVGYKTHSK